MPAAPVFAYASARPQLRLVREASPRWGDPSGLHHHSSGLDDEDALTALGEEIMTLSQRLASETQRFLELIAEFDRREGWKIHGFASCADWLAYSARMSKVTARDHVRVARALAGLPETSAAMARGEVSYSQVRAITRVADGEDEKEWLAHAHTTSAAGLEGLVRAAKRVSREDEAALAERRHAARFFSVVPDDDGAYRVSGLLDPEGGALLMRAVEAASNVLYKGSVPGTTPEQRRADALALLAELALAAVGGDSAESCGGRCGEHSDASRDSAESSAAAEPSEEAAPRMPWRSERYMVLLHVDEATLDPTAEPGRSDLEDGTRIAAESARRISCDASLVRVTHGRDGKDRVGARTRTIPPRLRRALEVRDRGCRFPGCGSRFTDGHHIIHWADGGPTTLENLVLLCRTHHRLLHEGGFQVEADPSRVGRPIFKTPKGMPIPEVPPVLKLNGRSVGSADGASAGDRPRWERDVPLALYLRALDALS